MFEIQNTSSFNTDRLTEGNEYDYVTRTSLNQGILQTTGFVNDTNINPAGTWSLGLLQMDFFYRNKPWYAGQFVRKIVPKIHIPQRAILFFQTILNMQKSVLLQVLVRNVDETFRNINVQLPQTDNGEINFTFIEEFLRELERARLRELERARLRELEAYLKATGLDNYELTEADKDALRNYKNLQWKEFPITKIFTIHNTHNILASDVKLNSGATPYLCASAENNGVNGYISYNTDLLEKGNCVFIGGKTFVVSYQKEDFYSNDSHNIALYLKDYAPTRANLLSLVTFVRKSLGHKYTWGDSVSKAKIKGDTITLPTLDGKQPDFNAMERLIAAMQKIVIADVAKYTARNLEATQEVIDNQEERQEPAITPLHIYDIYQPGRIPLYTLRAACGYFDEGEVPEPEGWIDVTGNGFTPDPKRHFAIHAKGDSMLPKIKDGDICIFEWYNAGTRNDEIVLTQSREYDPEYGGKYTIKRYHSEKVVFEEGWQHTKVELRPLNPDFDTVELTEDDDIRTIGIFKCVLLLNN